jgi:hypothetical protein
MFVLGPNKLVICPVLAFAKHLLCNPDFSVGSVSCLKAQTNVINSMVFLQDCELTSTEDKIGGSSYATTILCHPFSSKGYRYILCM